MANPKIEVEIGAITDKLKKGVDGSILSLNQLEKEAQNLNKALANATDVKEIVRLNSQLANTRQAMQNLRNAGIQPLTQATAQYNSVGIEFARIIQDAPFGIIGVGNNITQLAGSFSNLQKQTGSASKALGLALQSIVSPANLVVLGVSAVTTALTLYAQSARSTAPEVQTLKEKQDDYNESLRETDQILKQGFFNQLLKDVGLIQTIEVGGRLIDVQAFEKADEVLRKLGGTIDGLNKNQLQALQSFLGEKIADATRNATNATTDLEKSLALQDFDVYQKLLAEVNSQLKFYKTDTEKATKATKDLQESIFSFSTNTLVDAYFEAIRQGAEFRKSLEAAASGLTGNEGQTQIIDVGVSSQLGNKPPIEELADSLEQNIERIQASNQAIISSFESLGLAIGNSLNISNNALKGFITTLLTNTPKIIQAIIAQSKARKLASDISVQANAKEAAGEGIALGTKAANALGPVGLALLPVFVGGALALISGAFSKIGGGSSIGGGGVSGGIPKTFGGSGSTGLSFDRSLALTGEFRVKGQDLVYVFNEASSRNAKG